MVGEVTQRRPADTATTLGAEKVQELAELIEATGADPVVADGGLMPQQTVTLEDKTRARIVDRHRLVLEILVRQARSP